VDTKKPAMTLEQWRYIDAAVDELLEAGRTERSCPRCGGQLRVEECGDSYRVWCCSENAVLLTVRGL
jgi:hypothetical protein